MLYMHGLFHNGVHTISPTCIYMYVYIVYECSMINFFLCMLLQLPLNQWQSPVTVLSIRQLQCSSHVAVVHARASLIFNPRACAVVVRPILPRK